MAIAIGAFPLAGCTGDTGPAGDPGDPGGSCWDLNGNGACDPDSEDFTGDGLCDVQDCRIDGGGGGVACWDLDEDGACDADTEDTNGDGSCTVADCAGVTWGTLSGTVTNAAGGALAAVAIDLFPAIGGVDLTSDASGVFGADLPIGSYAVTLELDGYDVETITVPIAAGETTTVEVVLVPQAGVVVDAGSDAHGAPGATASATASVTIRDGSTVSAYAWTHVSGPALSVSGETTDTLSVTFASETSYRSALLAHLSFPDRLQVVAINPFSLEETGVSTYRVTVTTSGGTYTDTVSFHADLPYAVNPGLRNVPRNKGVLVHAPTADTYGWSLAAPGGSSAALDATNAQTVLFTPDVAGDYTLSVGGASLVVTAASWVGAVGGIGADGRVTGKPACTGCHSGTIAPDMFTPWRQSGHAEIFQTNLNTSGHYGEGCFSCHTVGYDPAADNGGIDEAGDFGGFMSSALMHGPSPTNYSTMMTDFPQSFAYTNIQCESCHGPNGDAHVNGTSADRASLSSDVCATCHGEPLRHARFQQWELSGHARMELTSHGTVEGRGTTAAHCGRCHSAQGFLAWLEGGDLSRQIQGAFGNATVAEMTAWGMTANEVQPQTCVVCHDPHMPGSTSGEPNNATVRLQGSTPVLPAGFPALAVGRGAICMACHNTRNGLHNDTVTMSSLSGPHTPSQADIVMGHNAYFVTPGSRGGHSYLSDTCATCHMESQDPPADLSHALGGTNHSFGATVEICGNCHGDFDGAGLKTAFAAEIHRLGDWLGHQAEVALNALGTIDVRAFDEATDLYSSTGAGITFNVSLTTNPITHVEVTEGHGQIELHLTFGGPPIDVTWTDGSTTSTNEFGVQLQSLRRAGTSNPVYPAGSNMAKAAWNYLLIEHDGSHGIHNPGFVNDIIVNTGLQDVSPP